MLAREGSLDVPADVEGWSRAPRPPPDTNPRYCALLPLLRRGADRGYGNELQGYHVPGLPGETLPPLQRGRVGLSKVKYVHYHHLLLHPLRLRPYLQ